MASNTANDSQTSLPARRKRAAGACQNCRSRKVRCDAALLGVPCTNCVAFGVKCRLPASRWEKRNQQNPQPSHRAGLPTPPSMLSPCSSGLPQTSRTIIPATRLPGGSPTKEMSVVVGNPYLDFVMKPKFEQAPTFDPGRVSFHGESSSFSFIGHAMNQTPQAAIHYPLPRQVGALQPSIDEIEIKILHQRGAFLLPNQSLCDILIESYFNWIHPIIPVINQAIFMRQYRDRKHPPSILLLQCVLLAGTHVCKNMTIHGGEDSTKVLASTIYKRAKALYDANYEEDRVVIVQSMVLLGWYWGGMVDVTDSTFDWTRVAITIAQASGLHRSVGQSQLRLADRRLWKRIWWTLYTRDRILACTLSRPMHIDEQTCDVEMLVEDDFIEDDPVSLTRSTPNPVHNQFFLRYIRLCEIIGTILLEEYSAPARKRDVKDSTVPRNDAALTAWLHDCPSILQLESRCPDNFWATILHSKYYTTVCLLHRTRLSPARSFQHDEWPFSESLDVALYAASVIESNIQNFAKEDQLRYCPSFIVYSLFSALTLRVLQAKRFPPSLGYMGEDRIRSSLYALKEVSKVWPVGKMVSAFVTAIIGEEKMQKRLKKIQDVDGCISNPALSDQAASVLDGTATGPRHHGMSETRNAGIQDECDDSSVHLAFAAKAQDEFSISPKSSHGAKELWVEDAAASNLDHTQMILSDMEVEDWLQFFQFE